MGEYFVCEQNLNSEICQRLGKLDILILLVLDIKFGGVALFITGLWPHSALCLQPCQQNK